MPVGNEEGELIAGALGDKRAILLSHHGQLSTGSTIEEACVIAQLIERAARLQLLAMAAGTIKPIIPALGAKPTTGCRNPSATPPLSITTLGRTCANTPIA